MTGEGMKIDFGGLGKHEDEIREIADKVQQAVDAAGSAQALDSDAFGLVGQIFALPIQIWVTSATDCLTDAANAGHEVADRVKTAHTAFSDHEQTTCTLIQGAGKGLA